MLQHTATNCNTLQHTATHYNTLQHTATHCDTDSCKRDTQQQIACLPDPLAHAELQVCVCACVRVCALARKIKKFLRKYKVLFRKCWAVVLLFASPRTMPTLPHTATYYHTPQHTVAVYHATHCTQASWHRRRVCVCLCLCMRV